MVGFASDSAIEEDLNNNQVSKLKNSNNNNNPFDPIDPSVVDINRFVLSSSFDESFVDFDTIKNWIKDYPDPDRVCSDKVDFVGIEEFLEMVDDDSCVKMGFQYPIGNGSDPVGDGSCTVAKVEGCECEEMESLSSAVVASGSDPVLDGSGCVVKVEIHDCEETGSLDCRLAEELEDRSDPIVSDSKPVVDESSCAVKVEGEKYENVGSLSCLIEEDLGKVSLVGAAEDLVVSDGNGKNIGEKGNEVSESSSSAESESSTSSSEEDSDDDDNINEEEVEKAGIRKVEVKGELDDAGQMEEGEIRDDDDDDDDDENVKDMVGWSDEDVFDGDDEDGEGVKKGPIKSKNELKFLPPVPSVDVTLQLCHQTLPVGVVLSILGPQVIVEGVENHSPLNEGSILWITERRVPLGLVDEIFGPVKNPYYIVRYNSENEVPAQIHEGTPISFVPEFANHVLNDKNVYKKGYDASGENDEEVLDEVEFSDDEKEAEYRRMIKTSKRGTNDPKHGNKKNNKKKVYRSGPNGNWKMDQPSDIQPQAGLSPLAPDKNRHNVSPGAPPVDHGKPGLVPPFPQPAQSAGLIPTPNGFWMNGMPCQPQPSSVFSNGFPTQSIPWLQQNHLQFPYHIPLPNGIPFQQPFDPNQRFLPNVVLGGQPSFITGQSYAPWPGLMNQNGFNPTTYGMGLQGQHAQPSQNVGGQGIPFQNAGGQAGGQAVPFQNIGGQGIPFQKFQNTGGQGVPFQNTGGQGAPFQNTGGQGVPFQNTGGQGIPIQNTGGQGAPFQNTGGQGIPFQNTGGQGAPFQITGGQGVLSQITGRQGLPLQSTGGQGVPSQNSGQRVPTTGFCMEQNHTAPPDTPSNTGNQHFNPGASSGRGRKPNRRGGGRFSRGRNQH